MCQPPKEPPVDAAAAIKELYARHDPDKLKEVDALLKKFAGREAQLCWFAATRRADNPC